MKDAKELIFLIINREIFNIQEAFSTEDFSGESLAKLLQLAKNHDILHIAAEFLEKNGLISDEALKSALNRQKMLAVFRREQQNFEFDRVCKLFEQERIDYIPLKGSVIKDFYPYDWMRTSSDIDILIKPDDLDKAIQAITENLGFEFDGRSRHDCSLISKNGVNLELHFAIQSSFEELDKVFEKIWDYTLPCESFEHRFDLTNEFLLFYIIAHAKYHFSSGGCGIRPFIDFRLLENQLKFSEEVFSTLIKESKCEDFQKGVRKLSEVWFEHKEHSELSLMMEEFILTGGVFGTRSNLGAADRYLKGGKFKYLSSRIFAPKEQIVIMYPICKKHPLLIPLYQIKRWFRLLRKDVSSAAKSELEGQEKAKNTALLLKQLGF